MTRSHEYAALRHQTIKIPEVVFVDASKKKTIKLTMLPVELREN